MRDQLKDQHYYQQYLEKQNAEIDYYSKMYATVVQNRGAEDIGAKRAMMIILKHTLHRYWAMYSAGVDLEEMKKDFPKVVDTMEKGWQADGGYVQMLWLLAIGILLDVGRSDFLRLTKLIEKNQVEDALLSYFIHVRQPNVDIEQKVLYKTPYAFFSDILFTEEIDTAQKKLLTYLKKKWYPGHRDTYWYGSDKRENMTYFGYWSFESAALLKVREFDINQFAGLNYFPTDLAKY